MCISIGISRDNSRGIPGGVSRGISKGISRCMSRDNWRGISEGISEDWMAEKNPWQKWSIWYLWEYFLVPEHRIPIWIDFELGCGIADVIKELEMLIFH